MILHLHEWAGAEPGLLAIHGSAMSGISLINLAETLSPEYRVIAPDLRGHGQSDKPERGYALATLVDDLVGLVGIMGLERPVILGFSIGGAIAMLVAPRVEARGLVLLDAVVAGASESELLGTKILSNAAATFQERYADVDAYAARWKDSGGSHRLVRNELVASPDGSYRRRYLLSALSELWASVPAAQPLDALSKVECPVFIVQATRPFGADPYLDQAVIDAQCRAAPGATLYRAERSNHSAVVRAPEPEMIAALKTFLASLEPAPTAGRGRP